MRPFETWLLNYAVNALWQVPVVFAAAWLAARTSHRAGPAFQHTLWTSAMLAEVLLPACSARPDQTVQTLLHWLSSRRQSAVPQAAQVTVSMGSAHAAGGLELAPALLTAAALLYLCGLAYFILRLSIGVYQTTSLRRRAEPLALTGYAGQSYHRYAQFFGVRNALVAASAEISSPITLGIRRPVLLLPSELDTTLLEEDLDAALAHEFAHMRRHDFAKNLAYEVFSLPIAFHPFLRLTRRHMAESRELVCDAMAAEAVAGRQRYARSLLRLATKFSGQAQTTTPHAIGIFDAKPFQNFERRVMNLTNKPMQLKGAARLATTALSLALIAGTCTSALAFRMQVAAPPAQTATMPASATITSDPRPAPHITRDAPAEQTPTPAAQTHTANPSPNPAPAAITIVVPRSATGQPAPSFKADIADASGPNAVVKIITPVVVLDTPQTSTVDTVQLQPGSPARISPGVLAGERISSVEPVYPPEAKVAKLSGTVVLHALIGKDGKMQSLAVASSTNPVFNDSAIEAVRQWTYKPYLLNGNPTEVDTTVTVNFQIF